MTEITISLALLSVIIFASYSLFRVAAQTTANAAQTYDKLLLLKEQIQLDSRHSYKKTYEDSDFHYQQMAVSPNRNGRNRTISLAQPYR